MSSAAIGGRYIVEDALGRGGMAAVYGVRDTKTGKRIALKRSWSGDPSRAAKRRVLLEREFHTLAQLRHPRIIEVYDFGVDEDGPYYTMELLDGSDLDKTGQLPWEQACSLLRDIASSLAILHSRGLVHRDVSSRNVRRTADGRAKLIDFGTMVSMGIANDVVGTPQFMPPEVVQMQALDARADLYSLGALGYYLLTGRHAYPASRSSELRDAWRSRPTPPSRLFPSIPAALSSLILQLIALDRGARPQSAAEVMERLSAIASLPKEELPEISRAYLTTPSLVGRQKALTSVRGRMLSLVRGDGGALIIEGLSGSGRSRMIDACVFEGKLLGATVVRTNTTSGTTAAWSVARALCAELFELMPEPAYEASRLARGVLQHLIEDLRAETAGTVSVTFPERSLLLRELRDFILALGRNQRILLVVDDADRIDEPSAALLAALADKTERESLMLVLGMEPETDQTRAGPLTLLRSLAHRVELEPLDLEQTEALIRSVFGDVPNVPLCAGKIYALAHGSPRTTMELAQHLVDRGFARYEAGRWLLPARLDEDDLPKTLSASLEHRFSQLQPDARELAEILAIADGLPLPLASCRNLTGHRDSTRVFQALEELVSARVVNAGEDNPQFAQSGFVSAVRGTMPEVRRRTLHARLAELLATHGGDVIARAFHLLHGGRERQSLELLCSLDLDARPPPFELLEAALRYAEAHAEVLTARALQRLRMSLLSQASLLLAADSFVRCLPHVLKQLQQDSGLALYHELEGLPPSERLAQALTRQQERYLATPEREQVYSVGDAARELARLIGATCSMAGSVADPSLLDALPSLEPLLPLSPALRVVSLLARATRELITGRAGRAMALYNQALARIEEPDRAGMDGPHLERTRLGVLYAVALLETHAGFERAEERIKLLENHRSLRVVAWRVRGLLQLHRGNAEAAARSARRAELLQLQDESVTRYSGTDVFYQLQALSLAGDLLGVKSALDALESLAAVYPGWAAFLPFARSSYYSLQGDHATALEIIAPAVAKLRPGVDPAFSSAALQHVRAMREMEVTKAVLEQTQRYVDVFREYELTNSERYLRLSASLTFARGDDYERALGILEPLIQQRENEGATGLALGIFYEARARIATWMSDRAGFEKYAAACAREYTKGHNPVLNMRYAQLLDEARQREILGTSDAAPAQLASFQPGADESEYETVHNRILECVDAADRARCVLTMLLQSTDSYLGYLYGLSEQGLTTLAGIPETTDEPEIERWLSGWLAAERQRANAATGTDVVTQSDAPPAPETHEGATHSEETTPANAFGSAPYFVDSDGRRFTASALAVASEGKRRLVAMLAVQVAGPRTAVPPVGLRIAIATQLLEHGDSPGVAFGAA